MPLSLAIRRLKQSPAFFAVAVISLAIGIGGNLAMLGLLNAAIWGDLPFRDANKLVQVFSGVGNSGSGGLSYPDYLDLVRGNHVFSETSAVSSTNVTVLGPGINGRFGGEFVTPAYFRMLGTELALGHSFAKNEPGVLISHSIWEKYFAASPTAIGQTLRVGDAELPIVGVTGAGFRGVSDEADLWIPVILHHQMYSQLDVDFLKARDIHWLVMVGKLKPNATLAGVRANLNAVMSRLAAVYPEADRDRDTVVTTSLREAQLGSARRVLLIICGAGGFLFLIMCANLANLVLVRATARHKEMAVRTALGADTGSLRRLFVAEAIVLMGLGTLFGCFLAHWGAGWIRSILPAEIPTYTQSVMGGRVPWFGGGMTLVAFLILAFIPALRIPRLTTDWFGSRSNSSGRQTQRLRMAFVVIQTALATVLLFGAVQMTRSLWNISHQDLGFDPNNLVDIQFQSPSHYVGPKARIRVGEEIVARMASLPEVKQVALTSGDLLAYGGLSRGFLIEGRDPSRGEESDRVNFLDISSNYFSTLGVRLKSGRAFTDHDDWSGPAVAIVSETFARTFFRGTDVIGKRIRYMPKDAPWMTIVGIAQDAKLTSIRRADRDQTVYVPLRQQHEVVVELAAIVRSRAAPAGLVDALREIVARADPQNAILNALPLSDRVARQERATRNLAVLLAGFSFLAAFLAALGIGGVLSDFVSSRHLEIGIRMAVGATRAHILRLLASAGGAMLVIGAIAGAILIRWECSILTQYLFGISADDRFSYALVVASVLLLGFFASVAPVSKAVSIDPAAMLRRDY